MPAELRQVYLKWMRKSDRKTTPVWKPVIDAAGLEAHLIGSERHRQQVRLQSSRFRHLELRCIDSGPETKVVIINDGVAGCFGR